MNGNQYSFTPIFCTLIVNMPVADSFLKKNSVYCFRFSGFFWICFWHIFCPPLSLPDILLLNPVSIGCCWCFCQPLRVIIESKMMMIPVVMPARLCLSGIITRFELISAVRLTPCSSSSSSTLSSSFFQCSTAVQRPLCCLLSNERDFRFVCWSWRTHKNILSFSFSFFPLSPVFRSHAQAHFDTAVGISARALTLTDCSNMLWCSYYLTMMMIIILFLCRRNSVCVCVSDAAGDALLCIVCLAFAFSSFFGEYVPNAAFAVFVPKSRGSAFSIFLIFLLSVCSTLFSRNLKGKQWRSNKGTVVATRKRKRRTFGNRFFCRKSASFLLF